MGWKRSSRALSWLSAPFAGVGCKQEELRRGVKVAAGRFVGAIDKAPALVRHTMGRHTQRAPAGRWPPQLASVHLLVSLASTQASTCAPAALVVWPRPDRDTKFSRPASSPFVVCLRCANHKQPRPQTANVSFSAGVWEAAPRPTEANNRVDLNLSGATLSWRWKTVSCRRLHLSAGDCLCWLWFAAAGCVLVASSKSSLTTGRRPSDRATKRAGDTSPRATRSAAGVFLRHLETRIRTSGAPNPSGLSEESCERRQEKQLTGELIAASRTHGRTCTQQVVARQLAQLALEQFVIVDSICSLVGVCLPRPN